MLAQLHEARTIYFMPIENIRNYHGDIHSGQLDEAVEVVYRSPKNFLGRIIFGEDSKKRLGERIAQQAASHREAEIKFQDINGRTMQAAEKLMQDSLRDVRILHPWSNSVSVLIDYHYEELVQAEEDALEEVKTTDRKLPKKLQGHR